jgi:hypothetical protein
MLLFYVKKENIENLLIGPFSKEYISSNYLIIFLGYVILLCLVLQLDGVFIK